MADPAAVELDLQRRGWRYLAGQWRKVSHGRDDECPGWLEVVKGASSAVQPCDECQPGLRAVWDAGFYRAGWDADPRSIRVYLEAALVGGQAMPKPPNSTWERIQKAMVGDS